MSVPKGKRKINKLEVWLAAVDLAKYTMEITSNTSNFPGKYRCMVQRLDATAYGISEKLWLANSIYVGRGCDPRNVADRKKLQSDSIALCKSMLSQIDFAGKVLHRDAKKTAYWAELAEKTLNLARQWRDSDAKRLKSGD